MEIGEYQKIEYQDQINKCIFGQQSRIDFLWKMWRSLQTDPEYTKFDNLVCTIREYESDINNLIVCGIESQIIEIGKYVDTDEFGDQQENFALFIGDLTWKASLDIWIRVMFLLRERLKISDDEIWDSLPLLKILEDPKSDTILSAQATADLIRDLTSDLEIEFSFDNIIGVDWEEE